MKYAEGMRKEPSHLKVLKSKFKTSLTTESCETMSS